jgi:hypothetical protein
MGAWKLPGTRRPDPPDNNALTRAAFDWRSNLYMYAGTGALLGWCMDRRRCMIHGFESKESWCANDTRSASGGWKPMRDNLHRYFRIGNRRSRNSGFAALISLTECECLVAGMPAEVCDPAADLKSGQPEILLNSNNFTFHLTALNRRGNLYLPARLNEDDCESATGFRLPAWGARQDRVDCSRQSAEACHLVWLVCDCSSSPCFAPDVGPCASESC